LKVTTRKSSFSYYPPENHVEKMKRKVIKPAFVDD